MHIKALVRELLSKLDPLPPYYALGAEKKIKLESMEGFGPIATRILAEQRTYLHYDRLYTIWQALKNVTLGSPVVEVGVYKGGSAKFIHNSLRYMGKQNRLYICDTFAGHPAVDPSVDGAHRVHDGFSDTSVSEVGMYLSDCENFQIIAGDIRETARTIPHLDIGFLHIDVDVYPATKFCLEYFGREMARGAVIIVDDYGFLTCKGAKKAVDEYLEKNLRFWKLHLTTGQAVLVCLQ